MKVRLLAIFLIAALVCGGCASLRKKFTPQKTIKPKQTKLYYIAGQDYARPDSETLYRRYYAYWRGWEGDLIQYLGENLLADRKHGREALDNLKKMQGLLNAEAAIKLQPAVDELSRITEKIYGGELSVLTAQRLKSDLNRHKLRIEKEFIYSKITDVVKKDHAQTNN